LLGVTSFNSSRVLSLVELDIGVQWRLSCDHPDRLLIGTFPPRVFR